MEQKIERLNEEDRAHLDRMRVWVRDHFTEEARETFESIEGKIYIIDAILEEGWIEPHETWKLRSLGAAFGDALVQRLGLEWVAVEDDVGRDPALSDPLTTVIVFPLTMISKRVERGEPVDLMFLLRKVVEAVAAHRERLPGGGRN